MSLENHRRFHSFDAVAVPTLKVPYPLMPPFLVDEYHVRIVCALPTERAATQATLNEPHGVFLDKDAWDHNTCFVGRVHNHNMMITSLPAGVGGTTATASFATDMVRTFKGLRFELIVGIRGGVLNLDKGCDIRLGKFSISYTS